MKKRSRRRKRERERGWAGRVCTMYGAVHKSILNNAVRGTFFFKASSIQYPTLTVI